MHIRVLFAKQPVFRPVEQPLGEYDVVYENKYADHADLTLAEVCEYYWHHCQNIDRQWRPGTRSMAVGDVVEINGRKYMVHEVGFMYADL